MQKLWEALADANRRKILTLLKGGEKAVAEIHENFDFSGASLSHHLGKLKDSGLVTARRQGQQMIYSVRMPVLEEATQMLADLFGPEENNKTPIDTEVK